MATMRKFVVNLYGSFWILHKKPVFFGVGMYVQIITDPSEFYKVLVKKSYESHKRISISSLYLGTGNLENKLILAIKERMITCPKLRVHWLLDFTRGSRGTVNSRTSLLPLITQNPKLCSVSLFHTPELRGLLKRFIPQRWNEIIGLQHMKLYIFDDTLVISGANLSKDYFTNRQDRYIVFNDCPDLADFYHRIIDTVGKYSLQLQDDNSTQMEKGTGVHPFEGDYKKYCDAAQTAISILWDEECEKSRWRLHALPDNNSFNDSTEKQLDTLIFPTLQMNSFGIKTDSVVTTKLLHTSEEDSLIKLASGYFNLTEDYMNCILHNSKARYDILLAHPKANGFLGSAGFSGAIPAGYTQIAKNFFWRLCGLPVGRHIFMSEYLREGWTFHGKGLWYYPPQSSTPNLTLVGSPNFGWRSTQRDLESQVVLLTQNAQLQSSLHNEQQNLYRNSQKVSEETFKQPDRFVPYWVQLIMPIIKRFF
ncbi:unnamed protein product, partial [Meganyctiphanes norvegica]